MTSKKIALLFPGQGAQYAGMGKALYDAYPQAKDIFLKGDEVLGMPLSKWILEGPEEELTKTFISQPAIYLLSFAVFSCLKSRFPAIKPVYAAGLSLGEYSALAAAGVFDPWEGLKLVAARGRFMGEACDAVPGAMAALLGLTQEEVEALVKEADLPHDLWAANFNAPGQTVISGTVSGVEKGIALAKEKGAKKAIPLKVHGAFHSGLMRAAQPRLKEKIEATPFQSPDVRVVMNASADSAKNETELKSLLVDQIVLPVRWQESMERLDQAGVELYLELGCGKTLAALNKRIGVKGMTLSIETPEDLDLLEKELV